MNCKLAITFEICCESKFFNATCAKRKIFSEFLREINVNQKIQLSYYLIYMVMAASMKDSCYF